MKPFINRRFVESVQVWSELYKMQGTLSLFGGRSLANQVSLPRQIATGAVLNTSEGTHCPLLTLDNINPGIKVMQYAVRGPLVVRASEIEKELENGVRKPFDDVIKANIGDCQAMGQVPITFIREILALVLYPPLFEDARFACDIKERARAILGACRGGSVGAYTESPGIELVRRHAAQYIERRDGGIPSNWEDIILSNGASTGIKLVLALLNANVDGNKPGVMVPVPQYPLYSATLAEYNMHLIGYYLDESKNWALDISELQRAVDECRSQCNPRALVVINPGNPTGQVLTRSNIEEIIKFAQREQLFLFSDEVYQDNVYAEGSQFHSFKKVITEMGPPYNKMELASFMSCSKGYMGECGLRGGYSEIINLLPEVKAMLLKSISAMLCPNVLGQAAMYCVLNPPKAGEPSYEKYIAEKREMLQSLAERAKMVANTLNSISGMSCNTVQGAMYAFPQMKLPNKAIEKARKIGKPTDTMYAFELLENTGICIIPGSGFGQKPGTYHFRTTILPQPQKLKLMLGKFREFHEKFLKDYE